MAKLTSQQRKNLPDEQFGLPEDKSYPMPDESHVRSAIAYFHKCPKDKRTELARNINRIAKSYNMKIKLDKGSAFKPYADKEIVSESGSKIDPVAFFCCPDPTLSNWHNYQATKNIHRGEFEHHESMRQAINKAIANAAKNKLDEVYMTCKPKEGHSIEEFVYDTDIQATYDITRNFLYGNSVEEIMQRLKRSSSSIYDKSCLNDIVNRVKDTCKNNPVAQAYLDKASGAINDTHIDYIGTLTKKMMEPSYHMAPFHMGECKTPKFRNFDEIEITWFRDNISTITDIASGALQLLCRNGYPLMSPETHYRQEYLLYEMDRRGILDGYFVLGDNNDNLLLGKGDYCFFTMAKMRDALWVPIHNAEAKDKDGNRIMVVTFLMVYDKLHPNYYTDILDRWTRSRYQKIPKMITRRVILNAIPLTESASIESLTEGIHLSKEGDLKFVFTSNRSFMEKYSEIHKAIIENQKSKNYEAMKHDLAYIFALITACEDKMKVTAENDAEYQDALKARMFAKNDFRRYMKIVTEHDRKFNFMKFYQENDYDKKIYTIYSDDLIGLRNLFRKLVL